MRVAGIDIGSNTLLLLVADVSSTGELIVLRDECRFSRLGQGVGQTAHLADESVAKSLLIVREFQELIEKLKPDRIAAVGTQALRVAQNAHAFIVPAQEILGVDIEIISGSREAALSYRATVDSFPELAQTALRVRRIRLRHAQPFDSFSELAQAELVVADVGGASTEIIRGQGAQMSSAISLPIGAVSLAEKHLRDDPATAKQSRALFAEIDDHMDQLELPRGISLIGTAGTATTFATVELKMSQFDAERVQGLRLVRSRIEWHLAHFLELSIAEKKQLLGLEPQRADVIAAGAAIYARLMAKMAAPTFIVSGRGVRFGVCAELADTLRS